MKSPSKFAYVQTRIQSRYGHRAKTDVWLKLNAIDDLGSYLQIARQTPLRPWVLGISSTHNSHDIELALRQKYRQHIKEVAGWMPSAWQKPIQWIIRLADLPVIQYLAAGGKAISWMDSDPAIADFTDDDTSLRLQAMRDADCTSLVEAWQHNDTLITGWLAHWNSLCPESGLFKPGLHKLEKLLLSQLKPHAPHSSKRVFAEYEYLNDHLRTIFRRYSFQPTAVAAYLASVAIDIQHIRSDLMRRCVFSERIET